ncbi:MAG: WD40 repeat domain-containing protein [Anaerolineae bacterium]|nr:WD40 repeat domain-containing protein [Anaerolineae bacterium]
MRRNTRVIILLTVLLPGLLILAACGGDEDGGGNTPVLVAPPTAQPTTPTPTPDQPDQSGSDAVQSLTATYTRLGSGTVDRIAWEPGDSEPDHAALLLGGSRGGWRVDLSGADSPAVPLPFGDWSGPVIFSPGGRYAVAAGADGNLWLWDAVTGDQLFSLAGAGESAHRLVFSADDTQLAALIVPDDFGQPEDTGYTVGFTTISRAAFDPPLPPEAMIRVWNLGDLDAAPTEVAPPDDRLLDMRFAADGALIVAGSADNLPQFPNGISLSPQSDVTYHSTDFAVRLWDLGTGQTVAVLDTAALIAPEDPLICAWLAPGARQIAGIMATDSRRNPVSQSLWLWDLDDPAGDPLRFNAENFGSEVVTAAFSPDGTQIAASFVDYGQIPTGAGFVWVWDITSGESGEPGINLTATDPLVGEPHTLVFSPDGSHLATLLDGAVLVWDTATGAPQPITPGYFMAPVEALAFMADGSRLVSGESSGTIRVWDAAVGTVQTVINHDAGLDGNVVTLPDDTVLVVNRNYRNVPHINPSNGTILPSLETGWDIPSVFAAHPGGDLLATAQYGGTIRLWDLYSGQVTGVILAGHAVSALAFSPDGSRLVSGGLDGVIRVWDPDHDDEPLLILTGHTGAITDLRFVEDGSADGTGTGITLLSASRTPVLINNSGVIDETAPDHSLRWWDLDSGQQQRAWEPGESVPLDGALSGDGWRLAVPDDGVIRVWDVRAGVVIAEWADPAGASSVWAFNRDGSWLAVGSSDGTIHLWRLEKRTE